MNNVFNTPGPLTNFTKKAQENILSKIPTNINNSLTLPKYYDKVDNLYLSLYIQEQEQ